ncbi:hypothetical protein PIB30_101596 [Stylosanthes scabra]|uniref:Uncharacterized protein n=1 Tax=Stylosanthes scabra TaxID=79078 RepID=A0ABU6ZWA0_9FABA|nr:hypothetical protein [Stylosanthes scabra]
MDLGRCRGEPEKKEKEDEDVMRHEQTLSLSAIAIDEDIATAASSSSSSYSPHRRFHHSRPSLQINLHLLHHPLYSPPSLRHTPQAPSIGNKRHCIAKTLNHDLQHSFSNLLLSIDSATLSSSTRIVV